MKKKNSSCLLLLTFFLAAVPFFLSCATPPPPAPPKKEYVFIPPPPETPRIQFLLSLNSDRDFALPDEKNLTDFILGEKKKKKAKEVKKPYGVAIRDGALYVCDTDVNTVFLMDMKTRKFSYLGGGTSGSFKKPINIAVDADGTKYVTDTGIPGVVILDKDNNFTGLLGKQDLQKPTGIAVFKDRLFVTDAKSNQVFTLDKTSGKILGKFGTKEDGKAILAGPTNITVDKDGNLYVSETMGFRVQKLTQDGDKIKEFGSGIGDSFGQFARPRGIAVDREGRVYSVDAWHSVVQVFDADNNMLIFFGEVGPNPGNLSLPAQVVIDYDNIDHFKEYAAPGYDIEFLIIVTSQYGPRKVNIFGFLRKQGQGAPG